jgi:hypothetical protein
MNGWLVGWLGGWLFGWPITIRHHFFTNGHSSSVIFDHPLVGFVGSTVGWSVGWAVG